jgi:hypothetical protein
LAYTDVYVDDFCNLVQGNARRRRVARRILFHAIDEVLRPLDASHAFHQEPISVKKLLKGDGCWGTTKILLGWLIDTVTQTLDFPRIATHVSRPSSMIFVTGNGFRSKLGSKF